MNIVESISGKGVKTTPKELAHKRICTPHSGDIVHFGENQDNYPFIYGKFGRIENVGTGLVKKNQAYICCEMGSAFLEENGSVNISGGPFVVAEIEDLEPMLKLKEAQFWNWGDRSPGADNGVYYNIARPVFKLKKRKDEK